MKILHLIDSGGLYGAEKMLLALVKAQLDQGLAPMILSAGEPDIEEKPLEAEAKRLGLPIIVWRMKPGFNILESRKILNWAIKNNYDILHSHGFKFNILLGSYPRRFRLIPMVATLHGYVHAKRFSKMWVYELLDRFAINFLQGVVLVGEAMKKELPLRLSENKKVRVIKNGLDIVNVNKLASKSIEGPILDFIDNHSPIILGVGRLSPEKGFNRLIDAFEEFSKDQKNAGLIIVGEGHQKSELMNRVKGLGVGDKVFIPGYFDSVQALQKKSDLLVIPSFTEGLPITLLEAMAVGVPVIVSPVGEMPSVLRYGEAGYILPDNFGKDELAAMMVSLLCDDGVERKTEYAKKIVKKYYSVDFMERQYREFYDFIL